jgi:outer membrane receptor for ferrienterochelin and colicins
MWRPRTPLAFRAAVASGYRAPDFKELFIEFVNVPAGYAVRGNPDLQPEYSANLSGSVEWFTQVLNATLSGFHTTFRDFIEPRETATFGEYTYENVDRGRTSGAEVAASLGSVSRRIDASYAWLRATDAAGHPLLGRAAHTARLGATVAIGAGPRLSITSAFNGTTPVARDSSGVVTRWRASHTRLDARLGRWLDAGLAVDNVLDRRADEGWPGFSGRMWSVSVRVQR